MATTSQLLSALDRRREQLHALPGVVGTGVGVRDGERVVEIFVAGRDDAALERAIRDVVDFDFVVVPESEPAEAQASDDLARSAAAHPRREE